MSEAQFGVIIPLIGCPPAVGGVFLQIPLLMVLGTMLPPIAFLFRGRPASDS